MDDYTKPSRVTRKIKPRNYVAPKAHFRKAGKHLQSARKAAKIAARLEDENV